MYIFKKRQNSLNTKLKERIIKKETKLSDFLLFIKGYKKRQITLKIKPSLNKYVHDHNINVYVLYTLII